MIHYPDLIAIGRPYGYKTSSVFQAALLFSLTRRIAIVVSDEDDLYSFKQRANALYESNGAGKQELALIGSSIDNIRFAKPGNLAQVLKSVKSHYEDNQFGIFVDMPRHAALATNSDATYVGKARSNHGVLFTPELEAILKDAPNVKAVSVLNYLMPNAHMLKG